MSDKLLDKILFPWKNILSEKYLKDWRLSLSKLDNESLIEFLKVQDINPMLIKDIELKNRQNIPLNLIKLGELYSVIRFSSFIEQYQADANPNLGETAIIYISSVQFYKTNGGIGIIRYYIYRSPSDDFPNGKWSNQYRQSSVGEDGYLFLLNNLCPLGECIDNEKIRELLLKRDKTYVSVEELNHQLSSFQLKIPNSIIYYPLMRRKVESLIIDD